MIERRWEFMCRNCGRWFYRLTPDVTLCPNEAHQKEYMELYAVIDLIDYMSGFMGKEWHSRRQLLDKNPEV